ncbi:MAG: DUF924 family protein, partial [Limnobacter sp.]|nr:DUF924 family protein [Limnobacter sp.]
WFKKSEAVDQDMRTRFGVLVQQARSGELAQWREDALGRLAEILLIDQFSRNIFRGKPEAFSADTMALVLSQEAVSNRVDALLSPSQKAFLYMPFMHSESKFIHEQAMVLYDQPGLESNFASEKQHKAIIDRFGRYPHRNALLGRKSTAEEIAFLEEPNSSF